MRAALKEWMLLAIGVIVIVALVWGSMADRVTHIQEQIDEELSKS